MGNPESDKGAIQDYLHLINKLKNRLIDTTYPMQMALLLAVSTLTSLDHGLMVGDVVIKDLNADKMKLDTALKFADPRVEKLLKVHIVGSEATQQICKMLRLMKRAWVDDTPVEQVLEDVVYLVCFVRRWKGDMLKRKGLKRDHWISVNTWVCLEMNIVFLVRMLTRSSCSRSWLLVSNVRRVFPHTSKPLVVGLHVHQHVHQRSL